MLASMASFNDQEKCVELAGARIAIFENNSLITIF